MILYRDISRFLLQFGEVKQSVFTQVIYRLRHLLEVTGFAVVLFMRRFESMSITKRKRFKYKNKQSIYSIHWYNIISHNSQPAW